MKFSKRRDLEKVIKNRKFPYKGKNLSKLVGEKDEVLRGILGGIS